MGWGLLHTSLCPAVSPVVPQAVCYPTLLATSYLSGFRPVMLSATEAGAAVAIVSCSLATASLAYRSYIEKKAGFVSKLDMKKEVLLARTQTVKRVRKRVSLDPAATDGVAKRLTFFSSNLNRDSTPVLDSIRRVTNCTSSKKATFVPKELTLSTTPVSSHISGHLHERSESPLSPRMPALDSLTSSRKLPTVEEEGEWKTPSGRKDTFTLEEIEALEVKEIAFRYLKLQLGEVLTSFLEQRQANLEKLKNTPGSERRATRISLQQKKDVELATQALLQVFSDDADIAKLEEGIKRVVLLANTDLQKQGIDSLAKLLDYVHDFFKNPETTKKLNEIGIAAAHKIIKISWPFTLFPSPDTVLKTAAYCASFFVANRGLGTASSFILKHLDAKYITENSKVTSPFYYLSKVAQLFVFVVLPLRALLIHVTSYKDN
ncbi:MAG: hypothetical protein L7U87_08575 [Chlamydiales bacterium]|nr:hypothetical protein [Chlamydiales bacterium]